MLFYRVRKEYDQKKRQDGGIYIRNELYTDKEMARYKLDMGCLEPVFLKKRDTYWFFGARFENRDVDLGE